MLSRTVHTAAIRQLAVQVSARTGILHLHVAGDRVKLSGQAFTVLKEMLQLPSQ